MRGGEIKKEFKIKGTKRNLNERNNEGI